MSKRPMRKRVRQSDFKVVVHGVRREQPDYARLIQATLDHYQSLKQPPAEAKPKTRSPLRKEPS